MFMGSFDLQCWHYVPVEVMKAYANGGMTLLILNKDSGLTGVVILMFLPLCSQEKKESPAFSE
jgi:hypothetical protein